MGGYPIPSISRTISNKILNMRNLPTRRINLHTIVSNSATELLLYRCQVRMDHQIFIELLVSCLARVSAEESNVEALFFFGNAFASQPASDSLLITGQSFRFPSPLVYLQSNGRSKVFWKNQRDGLWNHIDFLDHEDNVMLMCVFPL